MSTAASPPRLKESKSGLKFESVSIEPSILPSIGPTAKAPPAVIVYVPPLSITDAFKKYIPFGPSIVPIRLCKEAFSMVPDIRIWLPARLVSTLISPLIFKESKSGVKFESVVISAETVPSKGPAVNAPPPVTVYESPLSTTAAVKTYIPLGPAIFPSKLARDPFSTVPAMSILFPAMFVSTITSPPIFRELGSTLNAASVCIWAFKVP